MVWCRSSSPPQAPHSAASSTSQPSALRLTPLISQTCASTAPHTPPPSPPQDGFAGYPNIVGVDRPRWGDYGASAVDEKGNVYLANE